MCRRTEEEVMRVEEEMYSRKEGLNLVSVEICFTGEGETSPFRL